MPPADPVLQSSAKAASHLRYAWPVLLQLVSHMDAEVEGNWDDNGEEFNTWPALYVSSLNTRVSSL